MRCREAGVCTVDSYLSHSAFQHAKSSCLYAVTGCAVAGVRQVLLLCAWTVVAVVQLDDMVAVVVVVIQLDEIVVVVVIQLDEMVVMQLGEMDPALEHMGGMMEQVANLPLQQEKMELEKQAAAAAHMVPSPPPALLRPSHHAAHC